jgi:hypothetical protein
MPRLPTPVRDAEYTCRFASRKASFSSFLTASVSAGTGASGSGSPSSGNAAAPASARNGFCCTRCRRSTRIANAAATSPAS